MESSTVPEGWYPDPADASNERWWDGQQWTGATRPAASGTADGAEAGAAPSGPRGRTLAIGVLVAVVALGGVALVALLGNDDDLAGSIAADEVEPPGPTGPDTDQDAARELPGMAGTVLHHPTPWISFGELPGSWRYEDFFATPVDPDTDYFSGGTELGHIDFEAGTLDAVDADDFDQFVDATMDGLAEETVTFEGPQAFPVDGGLDGIQWWGQFAAEEEGGAHFSALAIDLGDQWVGVYLAYGEAGPGAPGAPSRAEVDAWMRTIRIDTSELHAMLDAN